MAKVVAFDLDGTLTDDVDTHHEDLSGTYVYRRPNHYARAVMATAVEQGWTVIIYTGRREEQRRLTENWLYEHGFHYHFLIMGKAYYSVLIDDRAQPLEHFAEHLKSVDEMVKRKRDEESAEASKTDPKAKGE